MKQAQVRKYVRLTELIPEFMDYVDQKRIPIIMGVELSNFDKEMQKNFYEYFRQTGVLFKEQLQAIKEQDNLENLTQYTIFQLMNAAMPKAKDSGKVNLTRKKLDEYFPSDYSAEKREEIILGLLSDWKKQREEVGNV